MDYKVGSLADLISGNETPNKTKVIRNTFTPVKKGLNDGFLKEKGSPKARGPNTFKIKSSKNTQKDSNNLKPEKFVKIEKESSSRGPKKLKIKASKKKSKNSNIEPNPLIKGDKSLKIKREKRKLDASNIDLADSDAEQSPPKKQKREFQNISENEQNAAGRIKNKINKDTKTSSEYRDRTLFVGNIPINIRKEKIKKRFRKYGEIDTVRIRGIPVADPKTTKKVAAIKKEFHPDRNTVYAYIRFKNSEDSKKAEAENGELFENHHLRVHCCESDEKPDQSKAIFVGNLAFSAEEEELWNVFKPCGPIAHVRIIRDGRTGMGRGFGYVNFKDADSVQLALEMEKVMLKDRELRISLCDSSRAKKIKAPKKPRIRNRREKPGNQENGDDSFKTKKTFRVAKINPAQFSGTKFDDKKKKRKFNRAAIEKKKLAQKLVAPKHSIQ